MNIQIIVSSQVNTIVQPAGPDPETQAQHSELRVHCENLADATAKPVVLLYHAGDRFEFSPSHPAFAHRGQQENPESITGAGVWGNGY